MRLMLSVFSSRLSIFGAILDFQKKLALSI
jgi:hypothetical protein